MGWRAVKRAWSWQIAVSTIHPRRMRRHALCAEWTTDTKKTLCAERHRSSNTYVNGRHEYHTCECLSSTVCHRNWSQSQCYKCKRFTHWLPSMLLRKSGQPASNHPLSHRCPTQCPRGLSSDTPLAKELLSCVRSTAKDLYLLSCLSSCFNKAESWA